MPWFTPTLRARREEVRDDINAHLPGADSRVPNSVLRELGDAVAAETNDLDGHLDFIARMVMPDLAEGEFIDRWADIWLPEGRKPASFAAGQIAVTGQIGGQIATGARLTLGELEFSVPTGVTLTSTTQNIAVVALTSGAIANLDTATKVYFDAAQTGVDGEAVVATPGFAGGADIESDESLIARYIAQIQTPPHGGADFDYVYWMRETPGVTRAWATQEMGVGTVTLRFMMDDVRASANGIPTQADLDLIAAFIDIKRPVTVMDRFIVAPTPKPLNFTVSNLATDTPELRAAIDIEIADMVLNRAIPGGTIYESWIGEAISLATGEDHHDLSVGNVVPANSGEIVIPGVITYA